MSDPSTDSLLSEIRARAEATADALDETYGRADPERLPRDERFEDEVARLAQPEVDVDAVLRLSRGNNPYVACMALAALARRDDVPTSWTDSAVRALRRVPNEVEPFIYDALVEHAVQPVIGPVLCQLDEGINWQYLAHFIRDAPGQRRGGVRRDVPRSSSDSARSDDRTTDRLIRRRARGRLSIGVRRVARNDSRPRLPQPVRTCLGAAFRRPADPVGWTETRARRGDARRSLAQAAQVGAPGRRARGGKDSADAHGAPATGDGAGRLRGNCCSGQRGSDLRGRAGRTRQGDRRQAEGTQSDLGASGSRRRGVRGTAFP